MGNILLIEDNPQNARLAAKVLRHDGHTVTVAESAEQGILKALADPPDLIMVDLGLPDMDGQTVISLLKQQLAHTILVAYTAWPKDTVAQMTDAYGFDGVISKPVDGFTLRKQINDFLAANNTRTKERLS